MSWPTIGPYAGKTLKYQRIVFAGSANKLVILYKPQSSDCMFKMTILTNHIGLPEKSLYSIRLLREYAYPSIPANIDAMLNKCWANLADN